MKTDLNLNNEEVNKIEEDITQIVAQVIEKKKDKNNKKKVLIEAQSSLKGVSNKLNFDNQP